MRIRRLLPAPLRRTLRAAVMAHAAARGRRYADAWPNTDASIAAAGPSNPLQAFVDGRTHGRGIFKWRHYFEIYDRHLARFAGQPARLLEIGVLAGGSLDMWRHYLGPDCQLYGVDNNPASRQHEDATVLLGDQGDRGFWRAFREQVPELDIVVDDGSHIPEHQIVTLEELLPHLRPGGVYICEDVHGRANSFLGYLHGLQQQLCDTEVNWDRAHNERHLWSPARVWQTSFHSVHVYPFVAVIERRQEPVGEFAADQRGDRWDPGTTRY